MASEYVSESRLTRRTLLKKGLYGGLAAGLAGGFGPFGCGKRDYSRGPNIIFILIDALRADRLGLYGHKGGLCPAIDSLGADGITFERIVAQSPWTQPSMASLFCSCYPTVHKVLNFNLARSMRWGQTQKMSVFGQSFTTLAEVLRDNGYDTAGFIANYVMSGFYGFSQGFDYYIDMPYRKQLQGEVLGSVLNNEALSWLKKRRRRKPFFLYLHYMEVHGPYYARPEFHEPLFAEVAEMSDKRELTDKEKRALGYLTTRQAAPIINKYRSLADYLEFWSAFYDAGVREVDQYIGNLAAGLKSLGLLDDLFVVITADHGEELLEHGYWGHGNSLYDTELHVPLIMRWPGVLPSNKTVGGTARLIDVMPTLLAQLGIPAPSGIQGRSLIANISENLPAESFPALGEALRIGPQKKGLCLNDWKLIVTPGRQTHELYNIANDPLEQTNVYSQNSTRAKELTKLLQERLKRNRELALETKTQQIPMTPDQYEHLKSLGYVR